MKKVRDIIREIEQDLNKDVDEIVKRMREIKR